MKVIFGTTNNRKTEDLKNIIKELKLDIDVLSMSDIGWNIGEIEENGNSIEENSLIKAREAWKLGKTWTLADDSGLCIDALDGAPGIHSARYAENPQARIDRVLNEMKGIENRSARFKCCMTLLNPEGEIAFSYTGICEGEIVENQRGLNGFGYDPIFLVNGTDRTMAELSEDEKNEISHRGRALKEVIKYLKNV